MVDHEDARPGAERVLAAIHAATGGVSAADIAATTGLHVTTVRHHLANLADNGHVTAHLRSSGTRGRPSYVYEEVRLVDAREGMLTAVVDAAATGEGPLAARAQQAGERWAQEWSTPGQSMEDALASVFTTLGFAPEPAGHGIILRSCPFLADARRHPEVICGVHRGLALGLARRWGRTVDLIPLTRGGCVLALEPVPANSSAQ